MQTLALTITLTSDAEPGSGIGAVGLNQILPRDHNQRPMLQASHLKGLMLDALQQIRQDRGWSKTLDAAVFGAPGVTPSKVHLSDARSRADISVLMVSRTAVDDEGSKRDKSLRRVEALPCGHTLIASVRIDADPGTAVDLAARLAALSVSAIGGNRNRGSGACLVTIDGESRTPGALLKLIEATLKRDGDPVLAGIEEPASARPLSKTAPPVLRRLIFVADGPICCPERPVAPGNTIESGIAIPASAVQGALLTRLNAVDGPLASACFENPSFRAWPLLPAAIRTDGIDGPDGSTMPANLPMGIHVPLTHRISKLTLPDGRYILGDKAIEMPLPDNTPSPGSPLKGCDGVLLADASGGVKLWRTRDIPRMLSTHAVHRDPDGNRNLFSVLSLAPLVFSGLVSLPDEAAKELDKCLAEDNHISIGKARSVRGGGRLYMLPFKADPREPVALPASRTGCVFVVQSPLAIPDDWDIGRAVDVLARLVADAGWKDMDTDASYAECGLRFGWNRYGLGASVGQQGRLRARRCILPGSVVVLTTPLADPKDKLLAGIGEGREAGFGALLPHPGIAAERHEVRVPPPRFRSDGSGKLAYDLWTSARGSKGPSANQISAVAERFASGGKPAAITYLDRQKQERPARVWQRWEPVYSELREAIETLDPKVVTSALNGWKDLAATHKEERR